MAAGQKNKIIISKLITTTTEKINKILKAISSLLFQFLSLITSSSTGWSCSFSFWIFDSWDDSKFKSLGHECLLLDCLWKVILELICDISFSILNMAAELQRFWRLTALLFLLLLLVAWKLLNRTFLILVLRRDFLGQEWCLLGSGSGCCCFISSGRQRSPGRSPFSWSLIRSRSLEKMWFPIRSRSLSCTLLLLLCREFLGQELFLLGCFISPGTLEHSGLKWKRCKVKKLYCSPKG